MPFPAGICWKNVFQSTAWCPCKPLSKINSGCTSLAQSALSKLLPLSNGKGHIAEPFRCTSSPASLFWELQKKKKSYRGFGKISRWQLYNGGTFDSSEQRHRLCLSMDVLSIEKTFSLNCRVTKQKTKHLKKKSTQGELDFFWKRFRLPRIPREMYFWQGALTKSALEWKSHCYSNANVTISLWSTPNRSINMALFDHSVIARWI